MQLNGPLMVREAFDKIVVIMQVRDRQVVLSQRVPVSKLAAKVNWRVSTPGTSDTRLVGLVVKGYCDLGGGGEEVRDDV